MTERPEDVLKILEMAKRNLNILEKKMVAFGDLDAPPHILIQFEDAKAKVKELEVRYIEAGGSLANSGTVHNSPKNNSTTPSYDSTLPLTSGEKPPRTKVFISYSHKDTKWLDRLQVHLKPLEQEGKIDRWDDSEILPGMDWYNEIKRALEATKVAVLLISADFFASSFISRDEVPPLLEVARKDGAIIIPVIISPSIFTSTPLSRYQGINIPSDPLIGMSRVKQEETLVKLAKAIEGALKR